MKIKYFMSNLPHPAEDAALIELQIKIAYLEDSVDALNAVITAQDRRLKDMEDQLKLMYRQFSAKDEVGIAPFDLLADKPPHY